MGKPDRRFQQVRKPKNLHDSLANLCELFAATVGEDDVKLFKYHLKEEKRWKGTVIEIHVPAHIDFKWNHENLNKGRELEEPRRRTQSQLTELLAKRLWLKTTRYDL